jgi:hypothetical protein
MMRLLTEIRDLQREHLAEYRRVTERSLEMQERAMQVQASSVAKQTLGLFVVCGMLMFLGLYLYLSYRH